MVFFNTIGSFRTSEATQQRQDLRTGEQRERPIPAIGQCRSMLHSQPPFATFAASGRPKSGHSYTPRTMPAHSNRMRTAAPGGSIDRTVHDYSAANFRSIFSLFWSVLGSTRYMPTTIIPKATQAIGLKLSFNSRTPQTTPAIVIV